MIVHSTGKLEKPSDLIIKNCGFHIWSINYDILQINENDASEEVEWVNFGSYLMTKDILERIEAHRARNATPLEFLRAVGKLEMIRPIRVCFFPIKGQGQNGTGFASLISNHEAGQRSLVSIACGDGHGAHCLFSVVKKQVAA